MKILFCESGGQEGIPHIDVEAELAAKEAFGDDLGLFLKNNSNPESRNPIARQILTQWILVYQNADAISV